MKDLGRAVGFDSRPEMKETVTIIGENIGAGAGRASWNNAAMCIDPSMTEYHG